MEELIEKLDEAQKEYEQLLALNRWAWNMYGSELCADEMLRNEEIALKKVQDIVKLIDGEKDIPVEQWDKLMGEK